MNSPIGTWSINANGSVGTLVINDDGAGGLGGTVFGQPIVGFFDSASGTLYFLRVMSSDLATFQVYTGTVFPKVVIPLPNNFENIVFTLAGNFENYPTSGAISQFGWFAQVTQHVKGKDKEKEKEKEHKEKDKELKEKEKEHAKELEQLPMDVPSAIAQLTQRVNLLEQRQAAGAAFIAPEERPQVGGSATQEPPAGEERGS